MEAATGREDRRKLIEVSLPLETINRESTRENYIYKGNPSSVHKWWAQRPLAAARAVLFAQLVDDPSAWPDRFPTEELQRKERERLHEIIKKLVVWENLNDKRLLAQAHQEILNSTDGNPPPIIDPFAGGGTIPLEAQRLGLEAHGSDLNPVAVLINKALIEIPPKFSGRPPVYPGMAESEIRRWDGAAGLAADVRAYGAWIRDEAEKRAGHLYPKVTLPGGGEGPVMAWIWARTVTCPNPACGIEMPLVRSWWLGRKKGNEARVVPSVVPDRTHRSGKRVQFEVRHGQTDAKNAEADGTVGRNGATCVACRTAVELRYIRAEGQARRMGQRLMAIVVEGSRRRTYLPATEEQESAARVPQPTGAPEGALPDAALGFRVQAYGLTQWTDLFTDRQLTAMTTLSDLVAEARERIRQDILANSHAPDGDADGYADAVCTFLAFALSKTAEYLNSLAVWYPAEDRPKGLFAAQTIRMVWDFPEINPLGTIGGTWAASSRIVSEAFGVACVSAPEATITQADAQSRPYPTGALVSTDPPYYANVGYADLSDFFYVWLRRSLRDAYPDLLATMLVPKADELVADPHRHNGKDGAKTFFENGFRQVFARARESAPSSFPMTVYYAFKQSEEDDAGTASSGWETLLDGMIRAGWSITSTWPLRSERGGRMRSVDSNALASSIVLSLRPREDGAPTTDRRGFIGALQAELPNALRRLQEGAIAPVDLPQAVIGPGMTIFSRYSAVIEADGAPMTVRSALVRINEILDEVLNEQVGDFDVTTRFAIDLYRLQGYVTGKFGDAEAIAVRRNVSVEGMDRDGILTSRAGKVTLIRPADTPADYDVLTDSHVSAWEALHHLIRTLESGGIPAAGEFLATAMTRADGAVEADLVKELAFLLFSIAEKNGWTKDALAFNALATAWAEILAAARAPRPAEAQSSFDFDEDE